MTMKHHSSQVELGRYLFFFESPRPTDACLITAHGGYNKNQGSFSLAKFGSGVEVFFYGEHHKVLSDPGLNLLFNRPKIKNQHPHPDGDKVMDYILSKYQGKHAKANETYEAIGNKVKTNADMMDTYDSVIDSMPHYKALRDSLVASHMVTIRNKWNKSDVSLKHVISEVRKYRPSVTKFHCSFCRSLIGDKNSETSIVERA